MFPHVPHTESVGVASRMFAAFLEAALAFDVLYFGTAIY
jgi:hypothetical protein